MTNDLKGKAAFFAIRHTYGIVYSFIILIVAICALILYNQARHIVSQDDLRKNTKDNQILSQYDYDYIRTIIGSLSTKAMILCDDNGMILTLNPEAEDLLEYDSANMIGKSILQLIPTMSRDGHVNYLVQAKERIMHADPRLGTVASHPICRGIKEVILGDGTTYQLNVNVRGTRIHRVNEDDFDVVFVIIFTKPNQRDIRHKSEVESDTVLPEDATLPEEIILPQEND